MIRCKECGFPDTRPGLIFENGVCGACINYKKRTEIDWDMRTYELKELCERYKGRKPYDCLIPVSGGKDSHFLAHTLVREMGMTPLLATVTDSFSHTRAGSHNLRQLITKHNLNHWQYTISHDLFKRATRAAFEGTGEALKFVEYAIYTVPVMLAQALDIPLMFFGENSAYEYGTSFDDTPKANPSIEKMVNQMENDRTWWLNAGITSEELNSIMPLERAWPKVHYMSYYKPWSSLTNLAIAKEYGFKTLEGEWDRKGTIENFEQMDSVAYMTHLWLKYPKFGFQRTTDIATRRVREGKLTLEEAMKLIEEHDHIHDPLAKKDFCDTIGYTEEQFDKIVEKHRKVW